MSTLKVNSIEANTGSEIDINSTLGTIPSIIISGVTTVAAGSTAAPSITPTGDSDTGIFFPSADTIAIAEGGTEALRIDSSGRVTMPYQPIASLSDSRTNSITNAVLTSSNFYDTVGLNQGNHFNASTGRFTCPVAGVYRIYFRCSGTNAINVRLRHNGGVVNEAYANTSNTSVSSEVVIRCNADDYLDIQAASLYTVGGSQHKQVTFQLLY